MELLSYTAILLSTLIAYAGAKAHIDPITNSANHLGSDKQYYNSHKMPTKYGQGERHHSGKVDMRQQYDGYYAPMDYVGAAAYDDDLTISSYQDFPHDFLYPQGAPVVNVQRRPAATAAATNLPLRPVAASGGASRRIPNTRPRLPDWYMRQQARQQATLTRPYSWTAGNVVARPSLPYPQQRFMTVYRYG